MMSVMVGAADGINALHVVLGRLAHEAGPSTAVNEHRRP